MDKYKEFGKVLTNMMNQEYEETKGIKLRDREINHIARSDARRQMLEKLIKEYNRILVKKTDYDWNSFGIKNIIMVEP